MFFALDAAERVVEPGGGPVRGSLSSADLISTGGRRVQVWRLDAAVGQALQVDLRSGDFDPYVYVVGPGLPEGVTDDDGGEGLNARVCVVIDQPGEYRVVVSSLSSATGGYTLQVAERPGVTNGTCPEEADASGPATVDAVADLPTEGRVLRIGAEAEGTLSRSDPIYAGSPAQAWSLEGAAGQHVAIDLVSDAFDAYLIVHGPGMDRSMTDDDGAGGCNSRVELDLPESGAYRVVASTIGASQSGSYRLIAASRAGPSTGGSCTPPTTAPERNLDAVAIVGTLADETAHDGRLAGTEGRYDERPAQAWTLPARAGEHLMVEMRSSDFDSYLYLTGPGFDAPLTNDDGAGNLNARLCVEIPEDAEYRILAAAYTGGEADQRYTIRASRADAESTCGSDWEVSTATLALQLAALPTEGRSLTLGGEGRGELVEGGPHHPESNDPIQAWSFEARAGLTVYVDVVSTDFDAVLYAVGPGIPGILYVDDSGDSCNSRMSITPSESGTITLLPGSYYDDATGSYLIRASENPPELEAGGCGAGSGTSSAGAVSTAVLAAVGDGSDRRMEVGAVANGTLGADDDRLADGQPAQAWTMTVRAGETLVIDLVSDDFDPVLYVDGPALPGTLSDDDSLGNGDARLELTPTANGSVRLVVTAYAADGAGSFELRVSRRLP